MIYRHTELETRFWTKRMLHEWNWTVTCLQALQKSVSPWSTVKIYALTEQTTHVQLRLMVNKGIIHRLFCMRTWTRGRGLWLEQVTFDTNGWAFLFLLLQMGIDPATHKFLLFVTQMDASFLFLLLNNGYWSFNPLFLSSFSDNLCDFLLWLLFSAGWPVLTAPLSQKTH